MACCGSKGNTRPLILVQGLPTDETHSTAGSHGRVEIGERSGRVLEKHDAKSGVDEIKSCRFEAIRLRICLQELNIFEAEFVLTLACACKHRRGNIDAEDRSLRSDSFSQFQRGLPAAAAYINDLLARLHSCALHG